MKNLVNELYNFWKAGGMACCFILMAVVLSFFIKPGDDSIAILVFAWVIAFVLTLMVVSMAFAKPLLIKNIQGTDGQQIRFSVKGSEMLLSINKKNPVKLQVKNIKGQFWQETRYILFLQYGGERQMISIPVNEETFDDIGALAAGLEKRKKRLVVIGDRKRRKR